MLTLASRCCLVLGVSLLCCACADDAAEPVEIDSVPEGQGASPGFSTGTGFTTCDPVSSVCPVGMFCRTNGNCDEGVCTVAPTNCNGHCDGVCTCGFGYECNACTAHLVGTEVDLEGACTEPDPIYFPVAYDSAPERLRFTKYDPVRDLCILVTVESGKGEPLPFDIVMPEPWSLRSIVATDHALDCRSMLTCGTGSFIGESVDAIGATGSIELGPTSFDEASADLVLEFEPRPWLPAEDAFVALESTPNICF